MSELRNGSKALAPTRMELEPVPPSEQDASPSLWAVVNDLSAGGGDTGMVIDPGFGSIRLFCWDEVPPDGSMGTDKMGKVDENAVAAIERLREMVRESGGSVVVEQCPLSVKRRLDVWGPDPSAMEIMRRVKNNLDPQGILNPGRFLGGI